FRTSVNILPGILITWEHNTVDRDPFFIRNSFCSLQIILKLLNSYIFFQCVEMAECMCSYFLPRCVFYLLDQTRCKMINVLQFILLQIGIWIMFFVFIIRADRR